MRDAAGVELTVGDVVFFDWNNDVATIIESIDGDKATFKTGKLSDTPFWESTEKTILWIIDTETREYVAEVLNYDRLTGRCERLFPLPPEVDREKECVRRAFEIRKLKVCTTQRN